MQNTTQTSHPGNPLSYHLDLEPIAADEESSIVRQNVQNRMQRLQGHTYTNADGTLTVACRDLMTLACIVCIHDYRTVVPLRGACQGSELEIHCQVVGKRGVVAFIRPAFPWSAYVLLEDGSLLDGLFSLFPDHTFSLT